MTRFAKRYGIVFLAVKIVLVAVFYKNSFFPRCENCDRVVIEGFMNLNGDDIFRFRSRKTDSKFINRYTNLVENGCYKPKNCDSTEILSILIPYRNRPEQLDELLVYLHSFLINQQRHYCIYVIEQSIEKAFNRGALLNIGFNISQKSDCYITHDVDLIPIDPRNLYSCYSKSAVRMSSRIDKLSFSDPMKAERGFYISAGGVVSFTREQLLFTNGFSNDYWGWAPEDQDMARRVRDFDFQDDSFYGKNFSGPSFNGLKFNEHNFNGHYSGSEKWRNEYFSKFMTVDQHNGGRGLVRNSKFGFYKSLDFYAGGDGPDKVPRKLDYVGKKNGLNSVVFKILGIKKLKLMTLVKVEF